MISIRAIINASTRNLIRDACPIGHRAFYSSASFTIHKIYVYVFPSFCHVNHSTQ